MSVKFKEETITQTVTDATANVTAKGKELAHEVGEALTKGAGPNGYLAVSQHRV
jgi:hypothetical protein